MGQCHQSGKAIWIAAGGNFFPPDPMTVRYRLYTEFSSILYGPYIICYTSYATVDMQNTHTIQSYLLVSLISFEEFVRGSKEDRVSVVEDKRDLKLIFSRVELKHLKLTLAYVGFQIIFYQANIGSSLDYVA